MNESVGTQAEIQVRKPKKATTQYERRNIKKTSNTLQEQNYIYH